jgi:hypothetical protein
VNRYNLIVLRKKYYIFILYKMVLMSGSKRARYAASISNRTNTCGGNKKAGLPPYTSFFLSSNPRWLRASNVVPTVCVISKTIQTQKIGYRATIR